MLKVATHAVGDRTVRTVTDALAAHPDAVSPFNPLLNIWGMVAGGNRDAGVQGPDEAIDRYQAFSLYTSGGVRLVGDADRR
jgi:predicted amidohydrolase YtcJ